MPAEEVLKQYGNKIRVRVCGILQHQQKVLLINHKMLNRENIFWNFPGGGLNQNEDIVSALKREFMEETNLQVDVHEFIFINQHIKDSLHAIELFFRVSSNNLAMFLGNDPELNILTDLKWFSKEELENLDKNHKPAYLKEIAFT